MAYATNAVYARIQWCRTQQLRAKTPLEIQVWRAEEEGLRDAILKIDHTDNYRQQPSAVLERYMMGLQDGEVLIRFQSVSRNIGSSRPQGI